MSDNVITKPDDTGAANAEGTEKTAVGSADGVIEKGVAADAVAAVETKPAGDGAAKTALASAGEEKPADDVAKAKDDADKGKEGKEGEEAAGDPVTEALAEVEMPEGFVVSDADKGAVAEIAKTHNLTKDAVKDLITLQTKRQQAQMEQSKKAQMEFVGKMKAEALALPKETLVGANKFVQKYGSEGLKAKMADPAFYIGNDVDIINVLAIAQKAVDGGFVDGVGAGGGVAKSAGEVLYK
jgi:hypothetical protein